MTSKMQKKRQQTSKELNDASLSLFICCWAVTNLKIEKITIKSSQLFIQNTYPFLSGLIQAWFNSLCNSRKYPYPTAEGIGNSVGLRGSEAQEIPEGRGVGRLTHFTGVNFVSFSTFTLWKLLISDLVNRSLIFHIQLELTKYNDSMLWMHKNAPQSMTFIYRDCQHHGTLPRLRSGMNSVKTWNGLPQSGWEIWKTTLIVGFMILLSCTSRLLKQ